MSPFTTLCHALADVLDGRRHIEDEGKAALRKVNGAEVARATTPLAKAYLDVMARKGALPVCDLVSTTPLPWGAPQASPDPAYQDMGRAKTHVELIGPFGLVRDDDLRIGLYGLAPETHYGSRTHPAEEVFVMLAGEAEWQQGDDKWHLLGPGERVHHPSQVAHQTRSGRRAFMSLYVWSGDVAFDNYVYSGLPDGRRR